MPPWFHINISHSDTKNIYCYTSEGIQHRFVVTVCLTDKIYSVSWLSVQVMMLVVVVLVLAEVVVLVINDGGVGGSGY